LAKKRIKLNFYGRKGREYFTESAAFPLLMWIVVMFLTLELVRFLLIFYSFSLDLRYLDFWYSHAFFGLDTVGVFQMLSLLVAGYVLVHLGVFLTEPHENKRKYVVGIAFHIFGIVICAMYILAYDMFGPWIEGSLHGGG
jgi:hypothetical protein